jgi:hypothetical protein
MLTLRFLSAALVSMAALPSLPAFAQFCDSELTAATPEVSSQFGSAISLEGSDLVIGAPFASGGLGSPGLNGAGSVSVFEQIGSEWALVATLTSPNPEPEGQFGYDVAISGNVLVVGAPFEDSGLLNSGRVYVYRRIGGVWTFSETLSELSQSQESRFGHSVDVSPGGLIAVSAIRSSFFGSDAGAVYFYRVSGQSAIFEDRVGPNPFAPGSFFGTSISLSNNLCAVGAVFDSTLGNDEGATYLFERQPNGTWNEYSKLAPPVGQSNAFYGVSVSLRGSFLLVGAEGINNGAPSGSSGSAFVYRNDGAGNVVLESELASPTPISNGNFGRAVSLTDGFAAVSELGGGGAVHTYRRMGTNWFYDGTLLGINHTSGDSFGTDVALDADLALVGAPTRSAPMAPVSGAAFIYDLEFEDCNLNGLNDLCELDSSPSLDCDGNGVIDTCEIAGGTGIDCDSNNILDSCEIAAQPFLDCDGNGALDACEIASDPALDCNSNGRLDVCDIADGTEPDLNANQVPDSCEAIGMNPGCQTIPNSTGMPGQLAAFGSETVAANDIVLIGSDMPQNTFGFPIVSRSAAQVIPPGAAGFRCVGGSVGRDLTNIFNTGASGAATLPLDLNAIPSPFGPLTATAGETWYWQIWHRDSFSGAVTSTFTDSIIFTFQ